ncbi:hypothetical protein [Saccharopolyspora oryzae]|uniref:Uncharacterized protein n=1 Tax=Saccharopolyspora oryzae TaxID=2997343 RepID=A0ABT4VAH4_9PSEU|nr:hypothetical protein [Saccharopolyspora oryzae]MDA3630955.1 hypothetical protein [Saccharopolyspora oryzae]
MTQDFKASQRGLAHARQVPRVDPPPRSVTNRAGHGHRSRGALARITAAKFAPLVRSPQRHQMVDTNFGSGAPQFT